MDGLFERLQAFLTSGMRMSHLYQPLMLRRLIRGGGTATRRQIAEEILSCDPTQIEYYETIVRDMVGRVLTSKRNLVERDGSTYRLPGAHDLSQSEVKELLNLCDRQIAAYEERRGKAMWEHRRRGRRPIPGTVRYEVLKRARYRCELCGISADEKALEPDHISPKIHGGSDDLTNLQALCYTCNASKRDRDTTDFRGISALFAHREHDCIFCEAPAAQVVEHHALAYARRDGFPVTSGHTLIITKRHVADFFSLTQPELNAVNQLLASQKAALAQSDATILGFNIGVNAGEVAGQTVMHCHVHLFPRRQGDVDDPRGGVRHTIPGKGHY